ncbi:hypothetical protein KOW79_019056 [Hemibagrus wyckioides]|uniref:Uncharacterized protein n=1 Tax=Hemibagrus wyckioides TaxID=337641 RepID=A0A9D3SB36_9TELE|nr:hypothetical protein KOW79_019056 [Hemibagrus wyckioides]
MVTSKETMFNLLCLFVCVVLHSAPPAQGQSYSNYPINTTVNMGKSATFTCTVTPNNMTLNFTVRLPQNSYVLQCPGKGIKYPSMGLYGNCEVTGSQVTGTWQMSNIGNDVNGTAFTCVGSDLSPITGYLWITGASSYYLMLFGCVMGGFFGILIIFGVTYVSLKRSEKLQECFKGKDEDEDVIGGVEEETIKD